MSSKGILKLTRFLEACDIPLNLRSYKLHLAVTNPEGVSPLDAFHAGKFQAFQEDQREREFGREMILSLVQTQEKNRWLFVGVYKVLGDPERTPGGRWRYATALLEGQEALIGRVLVHHERQGRETYPVGKEDGGEFYVCSISEEPSSIGDFPGYRNVCESHARLKIVTESSLATWKSALENVKGVYLITDTGTGKLYIGSATGEGGFWQRWGAYAASGHGGNEELERVLKEKGLDYVNNFQYSILEVADTHSSEKEIKAREDHWKKVLKSRRHGYNRNGSL